MREHPWNIRRPSNEHHLAFRNLMDLHRLTLAWNEELGPKKTALNENSPIDPETATIEALLDDTFPEDLITRLTTRVGSTQTLVLLLASKEIPDKLENISRTQGANCATTRWPHAGQQASSDLRGILACIQDTFWGCRSERARLLVQRATAREVRLTLLDCPHQHATGAQAALADTLCRHQSHWARGFVQALNPRVIFEHRIAGPGTGQARCEIHWTLDR